MAKIRRATFRFPALQEEGLQIDIRNFVSAEERQELERLLGNAPPETILAYSTIFPLVFDPVLAVIRPPESFEELETLQQLPQNTPLADGTPNRRGRYSSNEYFIGLAVNDIIIHDGVFKRTPGIFASFVNTTSGQGGLVLVDSRLVNIGVLDTVKIVTIKSNTYSPWLYYGSIPERAPLAFKDGRNASSQGAIYPLDDTEILQAAGIRYFVDSFRSSLGGTPRPPFTPIPISTPGGGGGGVSDAFFMADVLDGDGTLGFRNYTSFKILQVQETVDFQGNTVPTISVLRADSFRSINYTELEYQRSTFTIRPFIEMTYFLFGLKESGDLLPFYQAISTSFNLVSEFIEFESTAFSVQASPLTNDSEQIASQFGGIQESSVELASKLRVISLQSETITSDNIIILLMSDLLEELDNETARTNLESQIAQIPAGRTLKLGLILQDFTRRTEIIQLANDLFGEDNTIYLESSDSSSLGWLQFVGLLAEAGGFTFDEDSLVTEQSGVDANTIKQNMLRVTAPAGTVGGTDRDRDGVVSTLDTRHYDLTLSYNPTRQTSPTSFLSNPGAEMRFWRKITPIGQLFNFTGTVTSSETVRGGNLLLTVDIKWPDDPDNPGQPAPDQPETNSIKVYVEYGANTNLESLSGEIEFQGRLFYPGYLVKTRMNNIISFNNPSELSAWFRILSTTARDIISFGNSADTSEEPLLVIRTNIAASSSGSSSETGLSPIFSPDANATSGPVSSFDIAQAADVVNDYLNLSSEDSRILLRDTPVEIKPGLALDIFDSGDIDVNFTNIEFDIIIPADAVPPSTSNDPNSTDGLISEFEYELRYLPKGKTEEDVDEDGLPIVYPLTRFFSVVAFDGDIDEDSETRIFRFKFNPIEDQLFSCRPTLEDRNLADDDPEKNTEFEIIFPYIPDNNGNNFIWLWDSSAFAFNIKVNGTNVDSFVEAPSNQTGRFRLQNPVDQRENVVTAEFINIAGDQRGLKIGSKLSIVGISGPSNIEAAKFANLSLNFTSPESIERVDAHFSNTLQGDSFYLLSPANGFVSLSGFGFTFAIEDGTAAAGGAFGTRLTGDLSGPILFFDAFADNTSDKTISKLGGVPTAFPVVDIVTANVVNTFGIPFTEILAILFEPPPPPDVERITSTRSSVTDRVTIIYSDGNALQQKYSFTNFVDYDTEDGWDDHQRSMRRTIPIYSESLSLVEKEFTQEDNSIIFDAVNTQEVPSDNETADPTAGGDRTLVAIGLEFGEQSEFSINDVLTYSLQASVDGSTFSDFGYTNGEGEVSSQLVIVPDENVFFQLPDTSDIVKIKLVPTEDSTPRTPQKIVAAYVESLSTASSPSIFETSFGEYFLFFTQNTGELPQQRQIGALLSKHDANEWQRPAALPLKDLEEDEQTTNDGVTQTINEDFERPITLITGYSNPVILKSSSRDTFFIFMFNHRTVPGTIDMIEMERALFVKIEEDNSTEASDADLELEDESQTNLVNNEEVKSYARVFKSNDSGGQNHIKTVLGNVTQSYSVEMSEKGDLYIALIDANGQFRLKYNRSLGGGRIDTSFNWEDLGIDLLDTDTDNGNGSTGSNLSKIISQGDIGALTLRYSEIEDILWLFIATTSPGKLFMVEIPEVIIRPAGLGTVGNDGTAHGFLGEDLTDDEVDEFFQIQFNLIKPILVAGKDEGLDPTFVEIRSSTINDFPPQIVSVEWLKNGTGHLYYVEEGRLRARRTRSSGLFWEDFSNV